MLQFKKMSKEEFMNSDDTNGTHAIGAVETTYDKLVKIFGKPTCGTRSACGKVSKEWVLAFEDGTIATIYDWKEKQTPKGMYEWHIGGFNEKAHDYVNEVVKNFIG